MFKVDILAVVPASIPQPDINIKWLTRMADGNRMLFAGREWLRDANIYDYRNRTYSPAIGRFMETDPIGYEGGDVNLYRYVGNDPVSLSDAYGLLSVPGIIPYGNWTGDGWANGEKRSENDPDGLPEPGDPDYNPPTDELDKCSEQHDRDLNKCLNLACEDGESKADYKERVKSCKEEADQAYIDCLSNIENKTWRSELIRKLFETLRPAKHGW